jgi:glutathione synthase/RimK-type ligase-like ATP-grasp enzyme
MSARILILSHPRDAHGLSVLEALERKGVEAVYWCTPDYPTRAAESLLFEGDRIRLSVEGLDGRLGDRLGDLPEDGVTTVWNRRPSCAVDREGLHPADVEVAERGCDLFRRSLFELLAPGAFWVNPDPAVRRSSKILQHRAALEAGLRVPGTLYSNDPREIRDFLRRCGGRVVYKPLFTQIWQVGDTTMAPPTARVTEELVRDDEVLRAMPGIFQELTPKAWELRVTVMGRRAITARVLSQQTEAGRLDWRRAYGELRLEPDELPREIAERCFDLLDRLGLVFGCLDFIVTPEGEHVFLEVNQAGQFLFVEEETGQPLLDAFTELLIQGRSDFAWDESRPKIRFADVRERAIERMEEMSEGHVPAPSPAVEEPGPETAAETKR